jgi:hypothetical protein
MIFMVFMIELNNTFFVHSFYQHKYHVIMVKINLQHY